MFPKYINDVFRRYKSAAFSRRQVFVKYKPELIDFVERWPKPNFHLNLKNILTTKLKEPGKVDVKELLELKKVQLVIANLAKRGLEKIPLVLKDHSVNIVRSWAQQCECVIAQRIRRGQQIFCLYSKLWEERALREFVHQMKHRLTLRTKEMLLASCIAAAFDWDNERITESQMEKHMGDLEYIYKLREATMTCSQCGQRLVVDVALNTVQYCKCPGNTSVYNKKQPEGLAEWAESEAEHGNDWLPFIERQDVLVWRQEHEQHSGLYAYKVYGRYSDVTAQDFLQVQLDTEYRREWDTTALELRVLDTEPNSGCEVLYWEMAWPRMFANRDYVFQRRSLVDEKQRRIVIRSQSTEHPLCPPKSYTHRVKEYWSYMVIKPYTELDQPGIEFSLTYFDNPGLSIPSPVAAWVAISGLPDFLSKLREAARNLRMQRETNQSQPRKEPSTPTSPPSNSPPAARDISLQQPSGPSSNPSEVIAPPHQGLYLPPLRPTNFF